MKVMFCDGFQNSNAKFYRSLINRINFTSPSLLMCSHNRFSFVIISSKNNSFVTFGDSNDSYLVKGFWSPPLTVQDQWGFLFNRSIFAPSGMTICGTVCFPYLLSYCLFFSLIQPQSCQFSHVDLACVHIPVIELLLSFALSVFLLFWYIVSNLALSSSGRKFTPKVSPVAVVYY